MIISFSLPYPLGSGSIQLFASQARKSFFLPRVKTYQAQPKKVRLKRKTPATNGCYRGGRNSVSY